MRLFLSLFIPIVFCFLIGFTASYFEVASISKWYVKLDTPPSVSMIYTFPIGWSIMNIFMGTSLGLIIYNRSENDLFLIKLFILQILTKFMWSISFFFFQSPLAGFINIIVLDILIIFYVVKAYPSNKASSLLFIPYILWCLYITYIMGYIWIKN